MLNNLIFTRNDDDRSFDKSFQKLIFGMTCVENNLIYKITFYDFEIIEMYWDRFDFFRELNNINDIILIQEINGFSWKLITNNISTHEKILNIFSKEKEYKISTNNFDSLKQFVDSYSLTENKEYDIIDYDRYSRFVNNKNKYRYSIFLKNEDMAIKLRLLL